VWSTRMVGRPETRQYDGLWRELWFRCRLTYCCNSFLCSCQLLALTLCCKCISSPVLGCFERVDALLLGCRGLAGDFCDFHLAKFFRFFCMYLFGGLNICMNFQDRQQRKQTNDWLTQNGIKVAHIYAGTAELRSGPANSDGWDKWMMWA
jgi:hypothetical protein